MRIRLSLLVVICLVTLLLWGGRWYLEGGLRNQASAPVTGVAWTPDADGQLASRLFLERLGLEVHPFRSQPTYMRDRGTLICVETDQTTVIDVAETRAILDWVSRGNTLIIYTDQQNEILSRLGVEILEGTSRTPSQWHPVSRRLPLLKGAEKPNAGSAGRSLSWTGTTDRTHLYTRGEEVTSSYAIRGEGEIFIFASPFLVSNVGLALDDNAALLRNLARYVMAGRPVFIDEYHGGRVRSTSLWDHLLQLGLSPPPMIHILLILALLAWHLRLRFGRTYETQQELSREGIEFARARADIHRRFGHTSVVSADLQRRLILAISRVAPWAITPSASLRVNQLRLRGKHLPVAAIEKLLTQLRSLEDDAHASDAKLVQLGKVTENLTEIILQCDTTP